MSVSEFSQPGANSESPSSRKQDKIVKCPWTKEDDIRVGELVLQYGTKSWSALAAHLPGRTGKQIRERWHNQARGASRAAFCCFATALRVLCLTVRGSSILLS